MKNKFGKLDYLVLNVWICGIMKVVFGLVVELKVWK